MKVKKTEPKKKSIQGELDKTKQAASNILKIISKMGV